MRHYEVVVVLSPMMNPDEATEAWDRVKGFITNREAEISHEEKWGTRRLAYPIRKGQYQFLEGSYHLTRFATDQPFNRDLETFLKQDDQVLRSLVTVTLPEDELAAQAAAQARAIRTPIPRPPAPGVEGAPVAAAPAPATDGAITAEAPPVAEGEAPTAEPATAEAAVEAAPATAEPEVAEAPAEETTPGEISTPVADEPAAEAAEETGEPAAEAEEETAPVAEETEEPAAAEVEEPTAEAPEETGEPEE